MVSPVVPLFSAPLLTPAPGLGRTSLLEVVPTGSPFAGETAESPDEVVAPVLAFCASVIEPLKRRIAVAVTSVIFTLCPPCTDIPAFVK
jgi:hypothetical protein